MYRVNIDTSDSESYSSAGSSYTPDRPRIITPDLRDLRRNVEKRKARVAQNAEDKKKRKEKKYPDLVPKAKGDLGTIGEEEEDQAVAE